MTLKLLEKLPLNKGRPMVGRTVCHLGVLPSQIASVLGQLIDQQFWMVDKIELLVG